MRNVAIIPGAGIGKRMNSNVFKPLLKLNGQYIFLHTLKKIDRCPLIDNIILIVHKRIKEEVNNIIRKEDIKKVDYVIEGGDTRGESVLNALKYVKDNCKYILIHDCVRPLVDEKIISKVIEELNNDKSVEGIVVGTPMKSTIKQSFPGNNIVHSTLKRSDIWEIQTPQVFISESLLYAYKNISVNDLKLCKDDSQVLEKFDKKIKILKGKESNIKITTPLDLSIAEVLMRDKKGESQ